MMTAIYVIGAVIAVASLLFVLSLIVFTPNDYDEPEDRLEE